MNKTLKLLLFLGIISALSGLVVGGVNNFVSPIIAENDLKAEKKNLSAIFPGSDFEAIEIEKDKTILAAYKAEDNGYVVKATGVGYNASDPIIVLIGFDAEGTTVAVKPLQQQETNGFGARCFETENIEKLYVGKTLEEQVDMLSGATFTSTAMKEMASKAQELIKEVK